ncbi:phosphotransferase family protein [Rhodococcus sp. IEGM 1354]|uniref:phosphotransferase family protein n=1 Tax=Rhodococcus sp. IEGM 1354 TaxID=3047088 RepID=UPI0024B65A1C|nr:phosphotransferase family protein [Rhodococcus sp. IEGM 1354]MDI9933650.1 phosphotransferase family protein [Rhodococcus sp. IEGM 1354]
MSYRFDAVSPGGISRRLVIRLAPASGRQGGPADVLRQVPLLTALSRAQLPVAPLVWSTPSREQFGTDAIIQERLPANSIDMFGPSPASAEEIVANRVPLSKAVETLAMFHSFDWRRDLQGWSEPQTPTSLLNLTSRVLARSPEPSWQDHGLRLLESLAATQPGPGPVGLVHGDFQTNNVLFDPDGPQVVAVVDWELADIGPQELDLAWAAMMADPRCWDTSVAAGLRVRAEPEEVFGWYGKEPSPRLWWHFALACLRYVSVAMKKYPLVARSRSPLVAN